MSAEDDQLLGLSEVAELLGASRQAVGNWRQRRSDFPSPVADLKSGPIWRRSAVAEWAAANAIALPDVERQDVREQKPAQTVALMNMKGGVGKSTLAANLGWYCAYQKNMRVLLVDLDPQFNLSQYLMGTKGYEAHVNAHNGTILDIFEQSTPPEILGYSKKRTIDASSIVAEVRAWDDGSRIDLVPSSLQLSFTLRNPAEKAHLLDGFLSDFRALYDLILIDCAPTESMLTTAAYLASESILIPVKPEFLSTIGLPLVAGSLQDFELRYRRKVEVLGIVFNGSAAKAEHDRSRAFVRRLAKAEGWYTFKNAVSYSDSYPKGSRLGTPIFMTEYARWSKISDFNAVAEEFCERLKA